MAFMKKYICLFLLLSISALSFGQCDGAVVSGYEPGDEQDVITPPIKHAKASAAGTDNAAMLSLVTWGVVLAVGIAVLVIVFKGSSNHEHSDKD